MSASITEIGDLLHEISAQLPRKLSEVLERFKPNEYMEQQLEEFLPEWADRPLHEFLQHVATLDPTRDGADFLNGEMSPVNIIWILAEFY